MATSASAVPSNITEINSELVKIEKASIDFIDSQFKATPSVGKLSLALSVIEHRIHLSSPEIRAHIGITKVQIKNFLTRRLHLWKLNEIDSYGSKFYMVEKQEPQLRSALHSILWCIQRRCQKVELGAGIKDLSSAIGHYFPTVKKELGQGLDGLIKMLFSYPNLFSMVATTRKTHVDDIFFKNVATLVDDVILLKNDENPAANSKALVSESVCLNTGEKSTVEPYYIKFTVPFSLIDLALGSNSSNIKQARAIPGVLEISTDISTSDPKLFVFKVSATSFDAANKVNASLLFKRLITKLFF